MSPRPKLPDAERKGKPVMIRMSDHELAELDRKRGQTDRAKFIRSLIVEAELSVPARRIPSQVGSTVGVPTRPTPEPIPAPQPSDPPPQPEPFSAGKSAAASVAKASGAARKPMATRKAPRATKRGPAISGKSLERRDVQPIPKPTKGK